MADNKQYISQSQENGTVHISEDVIATIVSNAMKDVEGVAGLAATPKRTWRKGTKISISQDDQLTIECYVIVYFGQSVYNVAKAVQVAVRDAVHETTGIQPKAVNVNISGIIKNTN